MLWSYISSHPYGIYFKKYVASDKHNENTNRFLPKEITLNTSDLTVEYGHQGWTVSYPKVSSKLVFHIPVNFMSRSNVL